VSRSEADGLKDRKRRATAVRIAASAARLAAEQGLAATTVDQIAEDAEVGRATFFRYYQTKENAVAEGITGPWLTLITDAIARQPAGLGALDAIIAAFTDSADPLPAHYQQIRELAELTRTSSSLDAWALRAYRRYEKAIAELAASRIPDLTDRAGRLDPPGWITARTHPSSPEVRHRRVNPVTVEDVLS
jgi:AcrR family transcriptional regulator